MATLRCPSCDAEIEASTIVGLETKCPGCGKVLKLKPRTQSQAIATTPKPPTIITKEIVRDKPDPSAVAAVRQVALQQDQLEELRELKEETKRHRKEAKAEASGGNEARILGALSIICAIIGTALFCIPPAAIGLAGLGVLLGGLGLLLAIFNGGRGLGLPIVGLVLCVAPAVIGFVILAGVTGAIHAVAVAADKAKNQPPPNLIIDAPEKPTDDGKEKGVVAGDLPKNEPRAAGVIPWQGSANIDGVVVSIEGASVGKATLRNLGKIAESEEDLTTISVKIENKTDGKKIEYYGWAKPTALSDAGVGLLTDNIKNRYLRTDFGFSTKVGGQITHESVYPGKSITDYLVFEAPVAQARFFVLELPCKNFGSTGVIKFQLDRAAFADYRKNKFSPLFAKTPEEIRAEKEKRDKERRWNEQDQKQREAERMAAVERENSPEEKAKRAKAEKEAKELEDQRRKDREDIAKERREKAAKAEAMKKDIERDAKAYTRLGSAKIWIEQGNKARAKQILESVQKDYPGSKAAERAKEMLKDLE